MALPRIARMVVGAGIGATIGSASILPMYMFIASVGMVPGSWGRSVLIFAILCLPLILLGGMSERHEGEDQQQWFRRIIPICLISAIACACCCAGPAFVANEAKTDASVVCFLSFGWLSGMQGAFFLSLAYDEIKKAHAGGRRRDDAINKVRW